MIEKPQVMGKIENSKKEFSPGINPPLIKKRTDFWSRKTNLPTYEIVGPLDRIDARDTVGARVRLKPGTEQYSTYYKMYPELEEPDRKLRPFNTLEQQKRQKEALFGEEAFMLALSEVCRIDQYISPKAEGTIQEHRVKIDPEVAARSIKGVARYLGADLVGISRINPAWIYSHTANDADGLLWGDPIHLDHFYAISMVVAHHDFDLMLAGRGNSLVSEIDTNHTVFSLGAIVGIRLSSYIRNLGYLAKYHGWGGGQVMAIPLAIDAGLGELGRNGMLITKTFGSALRLVTVTTDLPLAVDRPVDIGVQDLCAKCKKCSEVCPTDALSYKTEKEVIRNIKMWPVDAGKCYKLRGAHGGIHVCYYCMSACCWTKPRNLLHKTASEMAARFSLARTILSWLDDVLYGHKPRQHILPDWLNYTGRKPKLKERISTFLHHV